MPKGPLAEGPTAVTPTEDETGALIGTTPWPYVLGAAGVVFGTLGAVLAVVPAARIAFAVYPPACALLGATCFWHLSESVRARVPEFRGSRGVTVSAGLAVLGAAAAWLLSDGFLQPVFSHGSDCAPGIAMEESRAGRAATWLLAGSVCLMWLVHRLARFRFFGRRAWEETSAVSDSNRLARLPFALGWFAAWLAAIVGISAFQGRRPPVWTLETAQAHVPALLSLSSHAREAALAGIFNIAEQREREAWLALRNLDLDGAQAALEVAVCSSRLPDHPAPARLVRKHRALSRLAEQLKEPPATRARSNAAALSLLAALPFGPNEAFSGVPCPLLLPGADSSVSPALTLADLYVEPEKTVQFQGVSVLRAFVFHREGVPVETSFHVLVGGNLSQRDLLGPLVEAMGRPTEVARSIGNGAICALWTKGAWTVRLGPQVPADSGKPPPDANSPLWITCFPTERSDVVTGLYRGGWDPHGCTKPKDR